MLLVSRLPLFPMYQSSQDLSLLRDAKACWLRLSRLGYTLSVNGRMRKAVYLCPLGTCLENLKHAFHDISDIWSSCFVAETVSL
jgi:hypothetical protein